MVGKERHVLFLEGKSLLDGMKIKYVHVVPYIFTSKIKNKKISRPICHHHKPLYH